jgi:hypothetical protein
MARDRAAERAQRRELGYVGFAACDHNSGRLLKVALPDKRERLRVHCPVDGCRAGEHRTARAMARPRRRGETVDAECITDASPAPRGRWNLSDAIL